jgi:ankyrin repeat protein
MHFLKLQAECKSWIETVLGQPIPSNDLFQELRSGVVLCNLMNTLFPGSVKKINKSKFGAHQIENVGTFLNCLRKVDMKEAELFEPLDLHEKKNMMKVFKCLYGFSELLVGKGKAKKWVRKTDTDFTNEEIEQWKKDYGDIDMDIPMDGAAGEEIMEEESEDIVDDVIKADPDDFPVSTTVTAKGLGVTLEELIQAVDEVEDFKNKAPQETADATTDASIKAAQYAAQVRAMADQAASDDGGPSDEWKSKMQTQFQAIDDANEAMVDAQNDYQADRGDKKKQKKLLKACEDLKDAARGALDDAKRKPAVCAHPRDFPIDGELTNKDLDVSLAELIKACRKTQEFKKDPEGRVTQTGEDAGDTSRKAAKFAAQIAALGNQVDNEKFAAKMAEHSRKVQEANEAMVDGANAHTADPAQAELQKEFDDRIEELIEAAMNAARDAKRRPPAKIAAAKAADYPPDGEVSAEDLGKQLKQVIKDSNRVADAGDPKSAQKTADEGAKDSVEAAKLEAMVREVADRVDDDELKAKILAGADELETANVGMVDAVNAYTEDQDSEDRRAELKEACEELKRKAAGAVDLANGGLEHINRPPTPEDTEGIDPDTEPLHFATLKGDMSAVRDLLGKGMGVDTASAAGWTPLYTACWVGNLELVRFFIKNGANVNATNKEGWSCLHAGTFQGHKHIVKALLEEYDAEFDVQSNSGTTPLYHAAEAGHYTITKMLLEKGADVELGKNWKPIHGSVFNYHNKVTRLLIDHGADVDSKNVELKSYTPLHIAVSTKKPNLKLIEQLCAKATVDALNKNKATPLHLCAMWGHKDASKVLLAAGADVAKSNGKGRDAIEVAARNGHKELAKILADHVGKGVPDVEVKQTLIGAISAPERPPSPPNEE